MTRQREMEDAFMENRHPIPEPVLSPDGNDEWIYLSLGIDQNKPLSDEDNEKVTRWLDQKINNLKLELAMDEIYQENVKKVLLGRAMEGMVNKI